MIGLPDIQTIIQTEYANRQSSQNYIDNFKMARYKMYISYT